MSQPLEIGLRPRRVLIAPFLLTALAVCLPPPATAQGETEGAAPTWSWPEKAQNLQVLPKDWPGSRLSAPMRGFSRALGVRCSHCHVGEEGQPFTTYDFASDANPNKERAREMLRMLGDINEHLQKIEPSGAQRVNMWCHTCHRGRPRPMTLGEELEEVYRTNGIDAALAHRDGLEERFSNQGSYDFSETSLNRFGYGLLDEDPQAAIAVFRRNGELFPDSANVWDSLAEGLARVGDTAGAILNYRKSLELDPENRHAREQLRELGEGEEKNDEAPPAS